jgi:DNA-binding NarL/FixJ family response regulator
VVLEALRLRGVTAREMEVLLLMAQGLSNREIAYRPVLSRRTIEEHVERLLSKTGSPNRSELRVRTAQNTGHADAVGSAVHAAP